MLLQNLNTSNELCNGARVLCRAFGRHVIHVHARKHVIHAVANMLKDMFSYQGFP